MNKTPILAGGAIAAFIGYTQYRDFINFRDSVNYSIKNVQVLTANQQAITLKFNLVILNPVNYSISCKGLTLGLVYANKLIGTARIIQPFEIKANSITTIPATFILPYNSTIPALVALFSNFLQSFTIPLIATGNINFGLFSAKFVTNFNVL